MAWAGGGGGGEGKERIAVIGASGYVGRNLQRVVDAFHSYVELVSLAHRQLGMLEAEMDASRGEPGELSDIMPRIRGSSAMVCLAGAGRQSAGHPFEKSVVGSAALAVFLCGVAQIPRIVYLSGLGASPGTPIAYLSAKHRAEQVIRGSGLHYVIFRPSYIVGNGDHLSRYVESRTAGGAPSSRMPLEVYDCDRPIQPIHVEDAAQMILWGALKSRQRQVTLDLVGPDRIPFRDYMDMLADEAGMPIQPVTMEEAYRHALEDPEAAPFGVDDLGIIAGGFTGNFPRLVRTTGIRPQPVAVRL